MAWLPKWFVIDKVPNQWLTDWSVVDKQWISIGQKAGAFWVWLAQGLSDVWQNIIWKPIGNLAIKVWERLQWSKLQRALQSWAKSIFWEQWLKDFQQEQQYKKTMPWYNPAFWDITNTNLLSQGQRDSWFTRWGREVGKFVWSTALTLPIGWAAWAAVKWAWLWWSIFGKIWIWAIQWWVQTQASNLANEWKLATVWETLLWAGIWWWLSAWWQLWKGIKNKLYDSAFTQAKDSTKKQLANFWQTSWTAVREQNLSPSVKKWLVEIKDKLSNTRDTLTRTTDKLWNINGRSARMSLKIDLIDKLWYGKLNQGARSTKQLIAKLSSVINDMIPAWPIKPSELVGQIKQINSTLWNTLVSKWFQDLKGNAKITKVISWWMKDILEAQSQKWGNKAWLIKKLYTDYGKQKTVQSILKDEEVRKIMGRQLIWWWVWATIWWMQWLEDFKQWNIIWWLTKVGTYAVAGTAAATLSKNPSFLMKLWNAIEWAAERLAGNKARAWAAFLASKLKK